MIFSADLDPNLQLIDTESSNRLLTPLKSTVVTINNTPLEPPQPELIPELSPETREKKILVVTEYRSGSSFVSQLFNKHPDSFYGRLKLINHS